VYEHYQYIDIDRITADIGDEDQSTTDPGSRDQAARSQANEGLDPSDLAILRLPQRPQEYVRRGAGEAVSSTQQTTEEIEMTERDQQDTVNRQISYTSVLSHYALFRCI